MHLGLIGGIGPAATDFYYRGLIERHVAAGTSPEITICHADVREMSRNMLARAPGKQAEIFAGLVGRMKAAGAPRPPPSLPWAVISASRNSWRSRRCPSSMPFPKSMPPSRARS